MMLVAVGELQKKKQQVVLAVRRSGS